MKIGRIIICFLFILVSMPLTSEASAQGARQSPDLKIGLWTKQSSIAVSADAPFVMLDSDTHKIIKKYDANVKLFLVFKNKQIFLNDQPLKIQTIGIELETQDEDKGIEINKKSYRGTMEINAAVGGMTVINKILLDQYLYSVVPGEMPDSWSAEALKAQAVAARTFALYSLHKHEEDGFDLCATTHCQVYTGKKAEKENTTKAVDDTTGRVMLYNNKPIYAPFHTTSGGYTENSEDVWGTYLPYLRSVLDDDAQAPNHHWQLDVTPLEIQMKLAAVGHPIGNLQAIEVSPLQKLGKNAADRTTTGRIKTMSFIGDKDIVRLTGNQVRNIFSLKSTLFDISMNVPVDKKIDVPLGDYYKKEIKVELPPYQEKNFITDTENIRRVHGRTGEIISFSGFGWGHGLGLSQWGAKAMAEKFAVNKNGDFKDILNHYYKNIEIKKIY